ncbi:NADH-quinone oxidoreductase subunit NuoN [Skermania sp. ID1734]|uniref:NADH-quinone oxidoreductase subunit NuoN n=1 Tax=Skermania sp. ID1734 TaxID=2597516 RepID=UPI0011806D9B|nr:NADH-quinone oxidoreductase subunit NuoN [Skermania sp. ID1734]TSD95382.1 NADH-quinone oxidoreductase subunit NuoN [Skermania sp. ID1734]
MNLAEVVLPAPAMEYGQLAPMLIVFGVAVVGVVVEAFAPRQARYGTQVLLSIGGLIAAFVTVVVLAGTQGLAAAGAVAVDGPTLFLQGTILLIALLTTVLMAERRTATVAAFTGQASSVPGSAEERAATKAGNSHTEVFPLTLLAVGGMLLFPAANDLLTMFVALEVLSLPLYLLCGLARRQRLLSHEAALKYFLLGAFSSAFFLFGIAMLYGFAGTVQLRGIADAAAHAGDARPLLLIGVGLVAVGLLFKVGAVPFHSWIPDVYQGAPTPVTAFMAAATKIAAFGAMLRIFYVALPDIHVDWRPMMWAVAIATMVAGAVLAVTQDDVKRMLAYSSITHAGFVLTGLIAADDAGLAATMFYLVTYGFSAFGAFAALTMVRDGENEVTALRNWAGLGRQSPWFAGIFALFLLAFAGIPLTSGFVAKFAVFRAAAGGGAVALVIVGVVSSAVAAFFYLRVIVMMYFAPRPSDAAAVHRPTVTTGLAVLVSAAVTLVLGIFPQPVLDLAERAAEFVR